MALDKGGRFNEIEAAECGRQLCIDEQSEITRQQTPSGGVINVPQTTDELAFPGVNLYFLMAQFAEAQKTCKILMSSDSLTSWFSDYLIDHGRVSKLQIRTIHINFKSLLDALLTLEGPLRQSMAEIYPASTCEEWQGSYFEPMKKKLSFIVDKSDHLLRQK